MSDDLLMIHLSIIPGGNLESTSYFLFVIFMTTFPYSEFDVILTPFISY